MTAPRSLGNNAREVLHTIEEALSANTDDLLELVYELASMADNEKAIQLVKQIAKRNSMAQRASTYVCAGELNAAQDVIMDFRIRQKERGA